jgi:16S rRNA (cytidine1402-2'-O)-methyltransferase
MTGTEHQQKAGRLFIVATPIGNLADMTYRAVRTLAEVSLIAAEDTRHSRKLLAHYRVDTPLVSYHEHNARRKVETMLEKLRSGLDIALISDAGTPGIADPGYRLVQACHAAGLQVIAIPGPSALVAALSVAGVPTDRFTFEGFLPARAGARREFLRKNVTADHTLVFYEAPHRLTVTLGEMQEVFGAERKLVVARELTKLHEEVFRGTVAEALLHFAREKVRGELVLILPAGETSPRVDMHVALQTMLAESDLSRREIVKMIAREYGVPGSEVYRQSLKYLDESA